MIWCIIGITLFILAFIFTKLAVICDKRSYIRASDIFEGLGVGSGLISLIIIAVTATLIVISHTYTGKSAIQRAKDQHDVYIILLEENKDITIQNQLYNDIVDYNADLRRKKHCSKSLWTNWFYLDDWNKIEEIEIK
jgi:hypothetical protein